MQLKFPTAAERLKIKKMTINTLRKDRRINIRLTEHDMLSIQRVAAEKGLPYQPLISGLIHQYEEG